MDDSNNYKTAIKYLFVIGILAVTTAVSLSIHVANLQTEIKFLKTDYQILLSICNGKD